MICARMDSELQRPRRCLQLFIHSGYADDITLSTSRKELPRTTRLPIRHRGVNVGKELRKLIESNGFTINDNKSGYSLAR